MLLRNLFGRAVALNNLGVVTYEQARYAEAERVFQRAFGIRKSALGPLHPAVAECLNNLAVLYQVQKRYNEAERMYRESLATCDLRASPWAQASRSCHSTQQLG